VSLGHRGIDPRRAVARNEQGGRAGRELRGELRALLHAEVGAREGLGVIGRQQMFAEA